MSQILNTLTTEATWSKMQMNFKINNFVYTRKAWCQNAQADYCPLVIALMSIIIILSFVLIIYLCAKTSFRCKFIRNIFSRETNSSQPSRSGSIMSTLSNRNSTDNSTTQNVWSTDVSKFPRPPPTYEESQLNKSATVTRVIRAYPRKISSLPLNQSANVNSAFSMEQLDETVSNIQHSTLGSSLFPTYRCVSLTTSPPARNTLQRLSALSRQLLEENGITEPIVANDVFQSTANNDEIPPPYESVITTSQFTTTRSVSRSRNNPSSVYF